MKAPARVAFFLFALASSPLPAAPMKIILDADTGNEMDDLYAVARAVVAPEVEVLGLTSSHFNNPQLLTDERWHIYPTEDIDTVAISQELNEDLLAALGREDIPHPIGCDRMVGYAWGYYEGAPIPESPAVDFIIKQGRSVRDGERVNVVVVGAATNVAAAILKAPEIASRIHCYLLSMKRDPVTGAWNKNSFNARNDINALDVLLNTPDLELAVIPGNVSRRLQFDRKDSEARLKGDHPVVEILRRRWEEVSAGNSWIMWDLALIEALIDPEKASVVQAPAPPENLSRKIDVYTDIDAEAMKAAFWESLVPFLGGRAHRSGAQVARLEDSKTEKYIMERGNH